MENAISTIYIIISDDSILQGAEVGAILKFRAEFRLLSFSPVHHCSTSQLARTLNVFWIWGATTERTILHEGFFFSNGWTDIGLCPHFRRNNWRQSYFYWGFPRIQLTFHCSIVNSKQFRTEFLKQCSDKLIAHLGLRNCMATRVSQRFFLRDEQNPEGRSKFMIHTFLL